MHSFQIWRKSKSSGLKVQLHFYKRKDNRHNINHYIPFGIATKKARMIIAYMGWDHPQPGNQIYQKIQVPRHEMMLIMVLKLWETDQKCEHKARIKTGTTDVMLSPSWLDRGKKYNIHDENISWHFQHRSKNSYFMWANCCIFPSAPKVILEVWKRWRVRFCSQTNWFH